MLPILTSSADGRATTNWLAWAYANRVTSPKARKGTGGEGVILSIRSEGARSFVEAAGQAAQKRQHLLQVVAALSWRNALVASCNSGQVLDLLYRFVFPLFTLLKGYL